MKKITLIAIAFIAVTFASCKKDYTCTCVTTGSSTANVTKIIGVSKKSATALCVSSKNTNTSGSTVTVTEETCTLSK
jgi:hypothetical protein